jgi:hypothetical protein
LEGRSALKGKATSRKRTGDFSKQQEGGGEEEPTCE